MGLLDSIFSGFAPQQGAGGTDFLGGLQSANIDWRRIGDMGMGLMEASGPSLMPVSSGQAMARGHKYANEQEEIRSNRAYKDAMIQATLAKQNDLESQADTALIKKAQGLPLTPAEEAALIGWDAKQRTKIGFDPITKTPYQSNSSILDLLKQGQLPQEPAVPSPAPVNPDVTPVPPPVDSGTSQPLPPFGSQGSPVPQPPIMPKLQTQSQMPQGVPPLGIPNLTDEIDANGQLDLSGVVGGPNLTPPQPVMPTMPNIPELGNNRAAQQKYTEGFVGKLGEKEAEKYISKVDAPKIYAESKPKFESIYRNVNQAIESAQNNWATGMAGASARNIPILGAATAAGQLESSLDAIRGQIGIKQIQDLKATNASLGPITEKEWPRVESTYGELVGSSPEKLQQNLNNFQNALVRGDTASQLTVLGIPDNAINSILDGDVNTAAQVVLQTGQPIRLSIKKPLGKNNYYYDIRELDAQTAQEYLNGQ